jgi:hypothetical protein
MGIVLTESEMQLEFHPSSIDWLLGGSASGTFASFTLAVEGRLKGSCKQVWVPIKVMIKRSDDVTLDAQMAQSTAQGIQANGERFRLYPGVVRPGSTVSFITPRPGLVGIQVFNIAGRLVRTLVGPTYMSGGSHSVLIDGRDNAGNLLPSGAYFWRMKFSGADVNGGRLLLLK